MHSAGDVCEGDTLVYAVLEERDCSVPSIVEDSQSGSWLLTLASVAENCSRLEAIFVDTDQLERPYVPVNAARRVLPEGRREAFRPLFSLVNHSDEKVALTAEDGIDADLELDVAVEDV